MFCVYSKRVVLKNAMGLHARPASRFVAVARDFASAVTVVRADSDELEVDAKLPMRLLTGGFVCGDEIEISADGPDEREAVEALVSLVESLE